MSKYKYGLLLSQVLDSVSRPLEEEQVWALCYEISQSLLEKQAAIQPSEEMSLPFSEVTFAVETIYLRKDGKISFIPNSSSCEILFERGENLARQMKELSEVLSVCLENSSPNEFLKRQVGSDLEALMRNMSLCESTDSRWVNMVARCCVRHASCVIPSQYYCGICEHLVKEAMDMNNFLAVVTNEITQCESKQDAFSTFQLSQARPVISNWLQCMSEIREESGTQKRGIEALRSPVSKTFHDPVNPSLFSDFSASPPRSKMLKLDEQGQSPVGGIPKHHSTPAIFKTARRVLRPPERLVNQVTTWMLEQPEAQYDASWLQGQRSGIVRSSLGWFREAKRIRQVLADLQIDTAMDNEGLYNALRREEICFCCQITKFSLILKPCVTCQVCERKVCSTCIVRVASHELGPHGHSTCLQMSSHDSGMSSRDFENSSRDLGNCSRGEFDSDPSDLFGHIRKVFTSKSSTSTELYSVCKNCKEFIERYF